MATLTFTRASHDPGEHGQPCYVINVAKVTVIAGSVCPRHNNRKHNQNDHIRCTVIDTGTPDGCWHVQEPVEEVLAAIEAEKGSALNSFERDIERRVASLEKDRNGRDELDAAVVVAMQRMRC